MTTRAQIQKFLSSPSFGVVGASNVRSKYGNRVLRKYLQHGLTAYPVNPNEKTIEGIPSLASVKDLPEETQSISIVTPPEITELVMKEAVEKGIRNVWMQPGAQSERAVREGERHGMNVIADGACILVELG